MNKVRSIFSIALVFLSLAAAVKAVPKDEWAKLDGVRLHYYDIGDTKAKNAIVFVHGWTCNADFWKESMNAFPQYRVIAIDLVGHGRSEKPEKADYSMEYFAQSVEAVLKKAKVKKAVLVGHSMGTPVIRQFYRLYPDQTLGLVIVDGALRPFGPRAEIEKFFEPLFKDYRGEAPKFVDGLLEPTRADLKPDIRAAMLSTPDYVGISAMRGMLDDKIWTNDQIKVPVLAVMSGSGQWAADTKDFYQTIAPNLDFQMWAGVSHFLMMEKPYEFNSAVQYFIVKNKLLQ
ncbi:MAG TPA: alpha/beta hydrolase [Pyrinomonadaceae bacterium]|jgi:pimeloyl-ACP methyl ester carboxylesterase|nr:alpha/beta hydrolase [Pyrinomonadaceae bacterium]